MAALDQQEMLHMAIHASANSRPDDAIRTLKELIEVDADNGDAHFLIAANYAEIAMLEKSIAHYQRAIDLMPEQDYARMQFGLLLTAMDRIDEAREALAAFVSGQRDDCYAIITRGLHALFDNNLEESRRLLEAGLAANRDNEPLNNDVGRLIAEIDARQPVAQQPPDARTGDSSSAYLLSTYSKNN